MLRTLESLDSCRIPAGWRVQLIVVDNASTDATARIINETRLSRMSAHYVYEPKPGLSNARNTGLKHAEGDVILFTDDDVLVEETWIQELAGPIIEDRCDAAVGLVMLSTKLMRPWMTRTHKGWLASSLEAQIPHWPVSLVGANMGFSSSVLRQVPAFDPLKEAKTGYVSPSLFTATAIAAAVVGPPMLALEARMISSRLKLKS